MDVPFVLSELTNFDKEKEAQKPLLNSEPDPFKHQIENASLLDPPQGRRKLPKFLWACSKAALCPCCRCHSILPESREVIAPPVHPSPTPLPQNAISGTVPATSQYNMQEIAAWIGGCTQ